MLTELELRQVQASLKSAVALIVNREYEVFTQQFVDVKRTESGADFFLWLGDYLDREPSRQVTMPPNEAFAPNSLALHEYGPRQYGVLFDLWVDHRRSDLTLEGSFDFRTGELKATYTDLHVL